MKYPAMAMKAGTLAVLAISVPGGVGAEPVTNQTRCPVAVAAFDANNREKALEAVTFIKNAMEALDSMHTENGEPGIIAQLSDDGFTKLALLAVERCREYPKSTVYNSAAFVYQGTREAELSTGLAQ